MSTLHHNLVPEEQMNILRAKSGSKYNFAANTMRYLFTKEERMKDVNMTGYKKQAISPTKKRLNYILSVMIRKCGVAEEDYTKAISGAIKAMDDANRRNHVKERLRKAPPPEHKNHVICALFVGSLWTVCGPLSDLLCTFMCVLSIARYCIHVFLHVFYYIIAYSCTKF